LFETDGLCEAFNQKQSNVLTVVLPVFVNIVNIFLNNYTKVYNDKMCAKGGKKES
jgi:hypothetical protein